MGKDGDKSGGEASGMSRDEMKAEHAQLVTEEKRLRSHCEEVKVIFQKLEEAYVTSKGTFSVQRYGQLKDMIKQASSEQTINEIKKCLGPKDGTDSNKGGLGSLLQKAKEFSSDSQKQQEYVQQESSKSTGKVSGFFKKLKKATGFTNEPIQDEDVMSNSDLQRDISRKQTAIRYCTTQLKKSLSILEKLQTDYQNSKAHAPHKRYQDLKDMIKVAISNKPV